MLLTFQIYRNSTSVWTTIYPDYTDLGISATISDNIYEVIYKPTGNIKIYKPDDFDLLETILSEQKEANIKIIQSDNEYNFKLNLEQSYKIERKVFEGSLVENTNYNTLLEYKDYDFNVINVSTIGSVNYLGEFGQKRALGNTAIVIATDTYTFPTDANGLPSFLGRSNAEQDAVGIVVLGVTLDAVTSDGTNYLIIVNYIYIESTVSVIGTRSYTGYNTIKVSGYPNKEFSYKFYSLDNERKIGLGVLNYEFTRFRNFYTTVKTLVQTLDSSINFDETGTSTDSFYYLKSYTDESITPYETLALAQLTDCYVIGGSEPTDGATIGYLTFNNLIEFFAKLGLMWYIEDRSGTLYFQTKHISEISYSNGSINLNNYKNKDWTRFSNNYTYEEPDITILKTSNESLVSYDWNKVTMRFSNYSEIKELDITEKTLITDWNDVLFSLTDGTDKYSSETTNQFVLVALRSAQDVSYDYEVENRVKSPLTAVRGRNTALSDGYIIGNLYGYIPDTDGAFKIGDVQIIDLAYEYSEDNLKKRKKIELKIPVNLISDIDITKNVKFKSNWLQPDSVNFNLKDNSATLILKDL